MKSRAYCYIIKFLSNFGRSSALRRREILVLIALKASMLFYSIRYNFLLLCLI
jgi:hypothetical protein